jgi:RNA polymerase sigma factor for flagellar operon FliA
MQVYPHNAARRADTEDRRQAIAAGDDLAKLIEANIPYAHAIAAEVSRKLPSDLDRKDIQGWAELGLVEAANSFDRTRGVQFKTFAHYRIKGAVYDGLRKMGWYPKGQYQQMRFEMAANEYLKDVSGEEPRPASPEAHLQHLKDLTANLLSCYMLSLGAISLDPIDRGQVSAEEAVVRREQTKSLRRSLAQLPETNRRVLEFCYFEELTLEQVGQKLGLSKSWVCRLHAKSLEMLRALLTKGPGVAIVHPSATFSGTLR